MAKSGDRDEKKEKNVPVWLTAAEAEELDRLCREAEAAVPGARMSRSGYLAQVYRDHLKAKGRRTAA